LEYNSRAIKIRINIEVDDMAPVITVMASRGWAILYVNTTVLYSKAFVKIKNVRTVRY
jgi:hypothetical protein